VQLQQVILNLIMNAIEAMTAVTGRERCLTIASSLDPPASVTMTVADTGTGIDPTYRDRIFDPFFTTKSNGMGLGLSICRSIVEAHGGALRVTPASPFGTVFHLTLPLPAAGS
jgi:signal transduction histidine kinase